MAHLILVGSTITFKNLNEALEKISGEEEKRMMLRTFMTIGKTLKIVQPGLPTQEFAGQARNYHAFVIHEKDIFVALGEKLGRGSFKVVTTAIKLNDLMPYARLEVENKSLFSTSEVSEATIEDDFLTELHKKSHERGNEEGRSCLVPPSLCRVLIPPQPAAAQQKLVMFQKRMDGDGMKLQSASPFQQLHALRDVASGLAYLHDLGYVHMDMKPDNFLIEGNVNDKSLPVRGKVADFGGTIKQGTPLKAATLSFLAPEAWKPKPSIGKLRSGIIADPKLDSFALGISILKIVTGGSGGYLPEHNALPEQHDFDSFFTKAKADISKSSQDQKAKKLSLGMLDVAHKLMKIELADRLSCRDAAVELSKLIA